ncbi:hypothetical protein ADK38_25705 [Streptomyces varsoviensis]|uniref:Uncharacterized protein n=1 Tax=Streptomyces varsoviensis TaxID=67373 RepID=A0ABR5J1V7_9ACTN|nr:hypothetical protein ADK38_25705 [Streptomyces varsoviensis]
MSNVAPVPTGRAAATCRTVSPDENEPQSGGVYAGPFYTMDAGLGGPIKFWVAVAAGESAPQALLRVEAIPKGGGEPSEPAFYVRTDKATPVPEDSTEAASGPTLTAFPGQIFLPGKGQTVKITVTIGDHTGCFLKAL